MALFTTQAQKQAQLLARIQNGVDRQYARTDAAREYIGMETELYKAKTNHLVEGNKNAVNRYVAQAELNQAWQKHTPLGKAWAGTKSVGKKALYIPTKGLFWDAPKYVVPKVTGAIGGAVSKTFRTGGLLAGGMAVVAGLAYLSSGARNARKIRPGNEVANLPELPPVPPIMNAQELQAMMAMQAQAAQPSGREVLGPHTARYLGGETGSMTQPPAPNVDGKNVADLGSVPPVMSV